MARILFVTPYPISRIRIRAYGFVSQLAKKHSVTVLALCAGERDIADMLELEQQGIIVFAIREKRYRQYLRSLRALISSEPLQVAFGASPDLRAAIREQLSSQSFDLLHIEFVRAVGALPEEISIPVIWDAVDCISQLYEQGAKYGATLMLRLIGRHEAERIRRYENQQLKRFQNILVTSERDRQALLKNSKERERMEGKKEAEISVLAHGIDQSYFQRYSGQRERETLIFSGKMSFHANIAGVKNLVERIMPIIWRERPGVQLLIVGSNPPGSIRRLDRDPRIQVSGYVADMRPYIRRARVAVSPLPYAVGIQNKVLEAMALGTPVVASRNASAGLQVTSEKDLLIADEPEEFAAAVLRLLNDEVLWSRLADSGLNYITCNHNWENIVKQLENIYQHIMDAGAGTESTVYEAKRDMMV